MRMDRRLGPGRTMSEMVRSPALSAPPAPPDQPPLPAPSLGGVAARSVALLVATAACAVAVDVDWHSPVRTVLALSFLLFVPGLAFAELLEIRDQVYRLTIATAASLAFETLLAVTLVYVRDFSIHLMLMVLYGVTAGVVAVAVIRAIGAHVRSRYRPDPDA
jgi:uncharacterized membrane protein